MLLPLLPAQISTFLHSHVPGPGGVPGWSNPGGCPWLCCKGCWESKQPAWLLQGEAVPPTKTLRWGISQSQQGDSGSGQLPRITHLYYLSSCKHTHTLNYCTVGYLSVATITIFPPLPGPWHRLRLPYGAGAGESALGSSMLIMFTTCWGWSPGAGLPPGCRRGLLPLLGHTSSRWGSHKLIVSLCFWLKQEDLLFLGEDAWSIGLLSFLGQALATLGVFIPPRTCVTRLQEAGLAWSCSGFPSGT